jgi:hypothetical protein
MDTRLVKIKGISADDRRAWSELVPRCAEPNPFFEPDFMMLCAQHFESYAEATLVVAHESNAFRAVLPILGFEKPRFPPRPIAVTRGRPTAVRSLGTPLVDASCTDAAVGAVLDALHRAAATQAWPGIVMMDKLGSEGPVMESLRRMCGVRRFPVFTKETWERGMVKRGGTWENPLKKSRRRAIDRTRRALMRDTGAELTLIDRTLDPSVVDDFLRIEVEGWKGREGGLAFAKDAATTAWFRDWYARWSASGRLTALCLSVGEAPVDIEIFVRAGDGLFSFRGSYDEKYAKYGPGAMTFAACTRYLFENTDAMWMDSATDKDNAFMSEMLPESRVLSTVYVGVGGPLDRGVVASLPTLTAMIAGQHRLRDRWSRARTSVPAPVGD